LECAESKALTTQARVLTGHARLRSAFDAADREATPGVEIDGDLEWIGVAPELEHAMPTLEGVLETVLYVDDFERARAFYEGVFALDPVYSDQRMCAYDVGGRSMLLLFRRGESLHTIRMPGGIIPPHDGSGPHHIAFSIAADELPAWETRLGDFGIAIEGRTNWPRGGISIYFRDPDEHLLELATPGLWPGH
jgi:catechol 2,3-dioxygenase-like lactoylglutathione lyase family enzyme